jgi:RHS repeat-associated protein
MMEIASHVQYEYDDDSQTDDQYDDQSEDQSDDQDGSQDDGQPGSQRITKSDLEIVIPKGGVYEVDSHYEMTVYINDVNREHTEVLGSYGGKESEDKNYVYGAQRLTSDGPQDKNNLTYLYDGRGSVAQTYKEDLDIKSYSYSPNGEYLNPEPNDSIFGYNGEEYNPNIDAQYLRARYLDVSMGRFLSQDTYRGVITNPASLNLYAYVKNDPVNKIDPSGHIDVDNNGNTAIDYGLAYNPSPASSSVENQKTLKDVQSKLNQLGYVGANGKSLTVDGINGNNTQFAVRAFQSKAGLTADGIAGPNTKATLFGSYPPRNVSKTPPPPAPVSQVKTSHSSYIAGQVHSAVNNSNRPGCHTETELDLQFGQILDALEVTQVSATQFFIRFLKDMPQPEKFKNIGKGIWNEENLEFSSKLAAGSEKISTVFKKLGYPVIVATEGYDEHKTLSMIESKTERNYQVALSRFTLHVGSTIAGAEAGALAFGELGALAGPGAAAVGAAFGGVLGAYIGKAAIDKAISDINDIIGVSMSSYSGSPYSFGGQLFQIFQLDGSISRN